MEFVFIFVAVIVAAAIVFAYCAAAKRRKALSAWAMSNGLRFDSSKDRYMDDRFAEFKCLRQGSSRHAYNIMEGDWSGLAITAFDYRYETGSGKNRSVHHLSAVILASPIPLKPLYIRREGFFDKLTEFFGFDDIDFESAEFSRRFYVKSADRRWAYDVIHQRMMEYLLSGPDFTLQFDRGHVIAWRSRTFQPADFAAAAEFIRGIYDRLPEYLIRRQEGQG